MNNHSASNEVTTQPGVSWWHALYIRHQHEKVVAQALSGKGFEVFLPQYRAVIAGRTAKKNSCFRFSRTTSSFTAGWTGCSRL